MKIEYRNKNGVLTPFLAEETDAAETEETEIGAVEEEPSDLDRLEAQVLYTAAMTGTILGGDL